MSLNAIIQIGIYLGKIVFDKKATNSSQNTYPLIENLEEEVKKIKILYGLLIKILIILNLNFMMVWVGVIILKVQII